SISAAPGAGASSASPGMPTRTSPPPCRTSPATIWANIGWRASRFSRSFPGRNDFNGLTDRRPRDEKGSGTEPGLIVGGQAAVTRRTVHRVTLIGGASAFAVVALAAAFSPSPASISRTAQPVVRAAGSPARPAPAPAADESAYVRASGTIGADLTAALQRAAVPERIGREYVRVLKHALPLANGLTVEDRFDLVYEPGPKGRLLYVGLDRVARADVELLKWTDGRETIWVNGDGVGGETSQGMRMPVNGRVTSGFGSSLNPILGHRRMHAGLDLAARYGSPIVAAADGRVTSSGWA